MTPGPGMAVSADDAMALIERWYACAVAAVEPDAAVRQHVRRDGDCLLIDRQVVSVRGRLVVIAVGKAALAMARAIASIAGNLIDMGVVLTKDGHLEADVPIGFVIHEAGHPIPDERGVTATRAILDLVHGLGADDVVVALISGGGSALLETPRPPVSLDDFAWTTDLLLRAGAPIGDLNSVRRPLSLVKAGGLALAAAPATVHTVILSDVLGNDTGVIASGPTVPGTPNPAAALATLDRYGVRDRVPGSIVQALTELQASDDGGSVEPGAVVIVGDNDAAVDAAYDAATGDGFAAEVILREAVGEAADLGRYWVDRCRTAPPELDVFVGGGEATVTVRGDGVGGRNTEFALAAALAFNDHGIKDWVVASLATDGEDGPTGAAGAIATPETMARAIAAGVDPHRALIENDSLRVFDVAGGVVRPGPTGTNVNDLYLAVRISPL